MQALNDSGMRAEMIYTGQTGWMQGARYGFVFDAVINDYVSGEVEHAIVSCDKEAEPDVMVIEGQSSLRNPSGPCGAEFLLSGGAHGVVLQHAAGREFFEGYEKQQLRIPSVADEIALIAMYGARTLAVTLNGAHVSKDELIAQQRAYERELGHSGAAAIGRRVGTFSAGCRRIHRRAAPVKITSISTWVEDFALTRPYTITFRSIDDVQMGFVEISTDNGLSGIGCASPEAMVTGETRESCQAALREDALAWLVGTDPAGLARAVPRARCSTGGESSGACGGGYCAA